MNKKPIIGIDIDGVITDYYAFAISEGWKQFGMTPVKPYGFSISEIFGVSKEQEDMFWKSNDGVYARSAKPRKGFIGFIKMLEMYQIPYVIITNRCVSAIGNTEAVKLQKQNTDQFISNLFSDISTKYFLGVEYTNGSKVDACKKYHVTDMIEDERAMIKELSENGIFVYKMDAPYNYGIVGSNIHSVSTFTAIFTNLIIKYKTIEYDMSE